MQFFPVSCPLCQPADQWTSVCWTRLLKWKFDSALFGPAIELYLNYRMSGMLLLVGVLWDRIQRIFVNKISELWLTCVVTPHFAKPVFCVCVCVCVCGCCTPVFWTLVRLMCLFASEWCEVNNFTLLFKNYLSLSINPPHAHPSQRTQHPHPYESTYLSGEHIHHNKRPIATLNARILSIKRVYFTRIFK